MQYTEAGSFAKMKNTNTALILSIIRSYDAISRADIAKMSGLTPATVTNITSELIKMGIVTESELGVSKGGRKPVLLRIVSDRCYVVGVYMGTAVIEIVLTDLNTNIISYKCLKNYKGITQDEALRRVESTIHEMTAECDKKVIGIGVGVHGLVRSREGIAIFSPNLGWENVRIKDKLEGEFKVPVLVDNDVHAMSLGESINGIASDVDNFVLMYIGRGIGGSIVIDHQVYRGVSDSAGEIGHTTVLPEGPVCSCGNRGCLQALASERVIAENYKQAKSIADESDIDIDDIIDAALAGDDDAVRQIENAVHYIGIGIANLINLFNPSMVVINGKISRMGNSVMGIIGEEVARRCLKYAHNPVRIVFSKLGREGFLKGAAALVVSELFNNPVDFII